MKILEGSNSITGYQPKMVEVDDYLIMNGSVYNSNDFTPIPYDWCNTVAYQNTCGDFYTNTKKYLVGREYRSGRSSTHIPYSEPKFNNNFIKDSKDDSITYGFTIATDWANIVITKRRVIDGKLFTIGSNTFNGVATPTIIGQCENYIYLACYRSEYQVSLNGSANQVPGNLFIYTVNKDTLSIKGILEANRDGEMAYSRYLKLHEDSDYIVLVYTHNVSTNSNQSMNMGDVSVLRINKGDQSVTRINKSKISGENYNSEYSIINEFENTLLLSNNRNIIYNCYYNKQLNKTSIKKNMINTSSTFLPSELLYETQDEVEIDWDVAKKEVVEQFEDTMRTTWSAASSTFLNRHSMIINKCNDKAYLTVIKYRTSENKYANEKWDGPESFTFEITPFGNLIFKTYTRLPDKINGLLLLDDEGKRMYAINDYNLYYIVFNDITLKFEVISTNNILPTCVGIDSHNRTWVISKNKDLHLFTDGISAKIDIEFEDVSYDYTGQDINTSLNLSCTSLFGNKIETDVELSIRGNAYFTQAGSKKARVTTLPLADLKIPITINGAGNVSVIPKVIM